MTISNRDKLKCVQRELALRKSYYWKRVNKGQMREDQCVHEIAVMEAIVEDYKTLVGWDEPQLQERSDDSRARAG